VAILIKPCILPNLLFRSPCLRAGGAGLPHLSPSIISVLQPAILNHAINRALSMLGIEG
jgi:hypothetical protein